MNERDKLLRKFIKSKQENDWCTYKKKRNYCNNQLRISKAKYNQEQLNQHELNPKRFWSALKRIFPAKVSASVPKNNNRKELAMLLVNGFLPLLETKK